MIALVTGSARGIGQAIVLDLAKHGYTVIVHYHHSHEAASSTLQTAQEFSPSSRMMHADLTQPGDIEQLFKTIAREYGRLDVLVNAVGNFGVYHPIQSVTAAEFDDVIATNVRATLLCMQQAVPLMQQAGGGRIINFGCATAEQVIARKYTVPYYIAKSGVIAVTKSYAEIVAPDHITVNTISPGIVENSVIAQAMPMHRPAQFSDIISTVQWLLSAEANYISGANIEVSGGWVPHH